MQKHNGRPARSGRVESDHFDWEERPAHRALLVTIPEAAGALAVGRTTIYKLIWSGRLTPIHIGRSVRLAVKQLEEYVEGLAAERPRSHG